MTLNDMGQAAADFWRRNEFGLKEFVIRDGKKHPFAIVCPGGGYNMVCSFLEGVPYARKLNERGYSAFVLYYRCKKKARYPAPMEDLARALRDILSRAEDLNLETDGYSIWGSSAGGHLAAAFGTDAMGYSRFDLPKPEILVLCYPVITMGERTHSGSRQNLLGDSFDDALVKLTSVEKQITANYPPTFVWCGDADRTVDPENSRMFAKELENNGIPYRFVKYPGVDHGVGLGKGLTCEGWFDEAISFWEMQPTKAGRKS